MRIILIILILAISGFESTCQQLATKKDSIDYSLGVIMGHQFMKEGIKEINTELFMKALQSVLKGESLYIEQNQAEENYKEVIKEIKTMILEENRIAGENFLTENSKRANIVTLPSGLQYEVLVEGNGALPKVTDKVTTHYHGTLIDGTVFDSSVERQEPISFPLSRVIKAWQEALPMMNVGSKWRIYSPYNLAYGERAAPPHIKAYSALIFEIELLAIE